MDCGLVFIKKITETKILMIALVVQPSFCSSSVDCDVIMGNGIRSSLMFLMVKCGLLSYAGYCVVGTTFREICLNPCLRDVVM